VEEEVLRADGDLNPQSFGSDGRILFLTLSRGEQAHAVRLDGKRITSLGPDGSVAWIPQISPNGRWMTVVKRERDDFDVYVRRADGSGPDVRVSQESGSFPMWRSDGREIFYRRTDGQLLAAAFDEAAAEPKVGPSKSLFYCGRADLTGRRWAVSRDGMRILLSEADRADPPAATVILNWDPAEKHGL
jgi:hypothetical protein